MNPGSVRASAPMRKIRHLRARGTETKPLAARGQRRPVNWTANKTGACDVSPPRPPSSASASSSFGLI